MVQNLSSVASFISSIQNRYIRKQKMQIKYISNTYQTPINHLHKSTSMPSLNQPNSSTSIQSHQQTYTKFIIKWILAFHKKIQKQTQYLALAYLPTLKSKSITITQQNYQKIGVALLLIACKINQIYPPKISYLLSKCQNTISKEEIISMQAKIVSALDYELALQQTPYTMISKILMSSHSSKIYECQKLLRIVLPFKQIYENGMEILSYAIIYLIIPSFIKNKRLRNIDKVKALAIRLFNIYERQKQSYQKQKQNRIRQYKVI